MPGPEGLRTHALIEVLYGCGIRATEAAGLDMSALHLDDPDDPYVIVVQPTVADPSRAPEGRHVGWAYCHVPNGSTADRTLAIEAQVERFAPGFRDTILARHTLTAPAMEAHNANYVGGDINGGSGDLGQLFTRPVASLHPWATPVDGLYL